MLELCSTNSYRSSATPCNPSTLTIAAANGDRASPSGHDPAVDPGGAALHLCAPAGACHNVSRGHMVDRLAGCSACCCCSSVSAIYQQVHNDRLQGEWCDELMLFRLIRENAADMIAVVDVNGRRLYNSPSYEKVLGYSPEELERTDSFEQIHPEDRQLVQRGGATGAANRAGPHAGIPLPSQERHLETSRVHRKLDPQPQGRTRQVRDREPRHHRRAGKRRRRCGRANSARPKGWRR